MSHAAGGLGRTDLRFLLPSAPRRVALPGVAGAWGEAFGAVGLDVVGTDGADAVITRSEHVGDVPGRPAAVIVEGGRMLGALRRRGLGAREFVSLPNPALPSLVVPVGAGAASGYLVRRAGTPDLRRAVRNRLAAAVISAGHVPFGPPRVAIGARAAAPPFPLAAARDLGVPQDATAALVPGAADLLSRGVLVLFAAGRPAPDWVIKFARVPQVVAPFDRDEHGLRVAAGAGPLVTARAPRLLGRMELDGLQFSVETAATGQSLVRLLESSLTPRRAKERVVERIAAWMSEVGATTARPAPALTDTAARLRASVLPRWKAPASLADTLAEAPAVLAHLDPGPWNVVVDGDGFTLLDWEDAVPAAPPLWDLVYFLSQAALLLDDADLSADPADHVLRVFQGDAPSSALVHRCVDRGARRLGLSPRVVGALVATCWMHHGMSRALRSAAVREAGGAPASGLTALPERLATRWLRTPGLGTDWAARVRRAG